MQESYKPLTGTLVLVTPVFYTKENAEGKATPRYQCEKFDNVPR